MDSLLEAALTTGETPPASPGAAPTSYLIVAGVSQEGEISSAQGSENLEKGVRTLRRINPAAVIVLLCEPAEEAVCRRAKSWGADDYFIVPLDALSARQLLVTEHHGMTLGEILRQPQAATAFMPGSDVDIAERRRPATRQRGDLPFNDLPSLPLLVQTELLEDLFTERADFPDRATAALMRHVRFNGHLKYIPAPGGPGVAEPATADTPQLVRRAVSLPEQPPFGHLVLEVTPPHHPTPHTAALLAQAANWLAGMLALLRRYEQLRSLAITDELSGAFNRRYFLKYMSSLLEKAKENRSRVTLLLFDIDDFKRYNDTFGHASGDAIIRELIKLLRACTREYDLVARIGGDEFAVVYRDNEAPRQPNSEHPKDVLVATERFREAIRNHQWPQTCNIKGEVSISGGLATFPWDADNLETLMAKADEALLKAKAAGKNVIVMHAGEPIAARPG